MGAGGCLPPGRCRAQGSRWPGSGSRRGGTRTCNVNSSSPRCATQAGSAALHPGMACCCDSRVPPSVGPLCLPSWLPHHTPPHAPCTTCHHPATAQTPVQAVGAQRSTGTAPVGTLLSHGKRCRQAPPARRSCNATAPPPPLLQAPLITQLAAGGVLLPRATLPSARITGAKCEGQAGAEQRCGCDRRRRRRRDAHRLALQALPHVLLAQQAVDVLDFGLPPAAQLRVWGEGRAGRRCGGWGRAGALLHAG